MKYLTIIRHAKSSWDQPGLADHDRQINERGRKAASAVGAFLHKTYFGGAESPPLILKPDRLVSSTALRALSTAQIMREIMTLPTESLVLDSRLYLAEAGQILEVVRDLDESWQHVVLFGHNPGMHEFAERILARAHVAKMPTCSSVLMSSKVIGAPVPGALSGDFPRRWRRLRSLGLLEEGEDDDSEQEEKGSDKHSGKHSGASLMQNKLSASENLRCKCSRNRHFRRPYGKNLLARARKAQTKNCRKIR
jgi:phosphohistidine phosphatase